MCAINGFNFSDEELLNRMNIITSHRGPDGKGAFYDGGISLGHNRLSIIDISESASQPMLSSDGRFAIVFNGEIYNFKELKKELEGEYNFKTKSDTEVILAAYSKWGKDCLNKLNGMFAFAVWNKEKKELFLARDHVGIKPLYYFWGNNKFIFSSEIKGILEHDVPRILNKGAFNHYFRVLYTPEPLTMFEGIYKLPPATYAVLSNGKLKIEKYWKLEDQKYNKNKKEIQKNVKEKVLQSVKDQLISDKPLGLYLSGGIDSSVILYAMSKAKQNIETFSVGFDLVDKKESDKFNKDFYLARKTAKYYGTKHHEVLLKPDDVLKYIEKAVIQMDEPISNPTSISMMRLAEFAKDKVDVVLGGDGGDELFGGYERYRLSKIASIYQSILPAFIRNILSFNKKLNKLNIPAGIDRFALFMFMKDKVLKRVISQNIFDKKKSKQFFDEKYFKESSKDFEKVFMNTDRQSWLVDESLMRSDKMSMGSGLEVRVPLLDKELVSFANTIPTKYKVSSSNTKIIFKEAFKKDLPPYLLKEPKRGWFSPGAKWLRDEGIYLVAKEVLSKDYNETTKSLFNWEEVQKILEDHCSKKEYNITIIWALLTFQIWAKYYKIQI